MVAEVFEQRILGSSPEEIAGILAGGESWLGAAAAGAGEDGGAVDATLRAAVGRAPVRMRLSKRVKVDVGSPQRMGEVMLVPVTWEANGFSGLFPVMDALVELRPLGKAATSLVFWGRYDPPLGRAGDLTDRFLAHRVAEATVGGLLDAIQRRVEEE